MSPEVPTERIPEQVFRLCSTLRADGHHAWIVGGCIRDLLMGRAVNDWDIATTAHPPQVRTLFRRTIPTGIAHGTVMVMIGKQGYEVTTLRGEGSYSDGRRPDHVDFVDDIEQDLARRDFTINAMAYDVQKRELVDPWGGLTDLDRRLIRAVGVARERFGEDGLRPLRAARFCSTLEFELESGTEAAIRPSLDTFRKVSAERVHEEWRKALRAPRPSLAFRVMRRTGLLEVTCAPLASDDESMFASALDAVDRAEPDPTFRLALLLGGAKPPGPMHTWADGWLRDLRCSNQERKFVLFLLKHRNLPEELMRSGTEVVVRRWLSSVATGPLGRDGIEEVLRAAQARGQDVAGLRPRVRFVLESGVPLSISELPVSGDDLLAASGERAGRWIGEVLGQLLDEVLEDPTFADREKMLQRALEMRALVGSEPAP